jgi:hypothetical protein
MVAEVEQSSHEKSRQPVTHAPKQQTATTLQMHPADVLAELCVLLEQYAPNWYSAELHYRVLKATRLPTEVLVELCALLEDYAPTWYTERQRTRGLDVLQTLGLLEEETPEEST